LAKLDEELRFLRKTSETIDHRPRVMQFTDSCRQVSRDLRKQTVLEGKSPKLE